MCVHDPLALFQNEALLRPRLKDAGLRFSSASFHRSKVHNSLLKSCGTLPRRAENFVIRTERKDTSNVSSVLMKRTSLEWTSEVRVIECSVDWAAMPIKLLRVQYDKHVHVYEYIDFCTLFANTF